MSFAMRQVYIILSKRCNLSCSFCIRDYDYNAKESFDEVKFNLVLKRLQHLSNSTNLIISGGEPTLHPNFRTFLSQACEKFKKVTINTNGTTKYFLSNHFTDLASKNKLQVQFSIDGYIDYHNTIRGAKSFEKTMNSVKECLKYKNIKVRIATTVTNKKFLDDFSSLYSEISKLKNVFWDIKRVSYSGMADISNYTYLSNDQWNYIVDKIQSKDSEKLISINKMFDFDFLDRLSDEEVYFFQEKVVPNCGSGKTKIYIYPNLDVLSCTCYEKYPSGNLIKQSLNEILVSELHMKTSAQEIDNPTCNICRYKKLCNGGCLGASFFTYNKLGQPDIKCPKVYDALKIAS